MTPWLLITALLAVINLAAFLAVRAAAGVAWWPAGAGVAARDDRRRRGRWRHRAGGPGARRLSHPGSLHRRSALDAGHAAAAWPCCRRRRAGGLELHRPMRGGADGPRDHHLLDRCRFCALLVGIGVIMVGAVPPALTRDTRALANNARRRLTRAGRSELANMAGRTRRCPSYRAWRPNHARDGGRSMLA